MSLTDDIRKMWKESKAVFFILSGAVFLFALLFVSMLWGIFGHDTFSAHTTLPSAPQGVSKGP